MSLEDLTIVREYLTVVQGGSDNSAVRSYSRLGRFYSRLGRSYKGAVRSDSKMVRSYHSPGRSAR